MSSFHSRIYFHFCHFYSLVKSLPEGYCCCLFHPSVQIWYMLVLRNDTWQLFHIFLTDQSYMEPVYCKVNVTIGLESMTFTLKIMSRPLLRNYKWQVVDIIRAYQPVHTRVIVTFLLDIMSCPLLGSETIYANSLFSGHITLTFDLRPWNYGPHFGNFACHCLENIHDNYYIFSGQINLTWSPCTVWIFWHCDHQSWDYNLHFV